MRSCSSHADANRRRGNAIQDRGVIRRPSTPRISRADRARAGDCRALDLGALRLRDRSGVHPIHFDPRNLPQQLRGMTRLPLVQLLESTRWETSHASGNMRTRSALPRTWRPRRPSRRAHAEGLLVHVWTFRAENEFLPDDLKSSGGAAAHGDLKAGNQTLSGSRHRRFLHRLSGHRRAGSRHARWRRARWRRARRRCGGETARLKAAPAQTSAVQPEHHPLTATSLPGTRLHGR